MIELKNKTNCCGCFACANKCPKKAIIMIEDEKGFKYPKIDKEKCVDCGLCDKVCPIINNKKIKNNVKAYACYNKNEQIRLQSSSGGIFTLIAENILKDDGVVFGAAFDEKFGLRHICVKDIEELHKLRTSKYFQSTIGETYKIAEEYLKDNKKVLFTGTPCQIEGLLSFLGKEYENLYTQDIICHGVPSPKVWKKYLKFMNKKTDSTPLEINFRQKENGWKNFALLLKYKDKQCKKSHNEDLFMKAFLKNVCLRDSCYECSFKKKNRLSDITLADFWGIKNIAPEMDDDKGTSLVVVNSAKGKKVFDEISNSIVCKEVGFDEAIKYNQSMCNSVRTHKNREIFFEKLDEMEFDDLIKKYVPEDSLLKKCFKKFKRIIRKIIKG